MDDSNTIEKEDEFYPISEYELSTTPNDFNVMTMVAFVESGVVKIPSFQRHYVWDIKRASKLIESLLIGLPIPQIFLYERERNKWLVIDGQQRMMTIYYFLKGRFPKKEKRSELGEIFNENGAIPDDIIADDDYFTKFNLRLDGVIEGQNNKFNGLNYQTLGDFKSTLDLATIRNMVVKSTGEDEDHGAMFEIFNRLNTGGVNLGPQEIRASLYHSYFLRSLYHLNKNDDWRRLLNKQEIDLHLYDVEAILRAFAVSNHLEHYSKGMTGFLNKYANFSKSMKEKEVGELGEIWKSFIGACCNLEHRDFHAGTPKFSVMIFETIFYGAYDYIKRHGTIEVPIIEKEFVDLLKADDIFIHNSKGRTTSKDKITSRLMRGRELFEEAYG